MVELKGYLYRKFTGKLTPEEKEAEEERKRFKSEIAKEKRAAYWTARKDREISMAKARGSSYKPMGQSIGSGFKTLGKGIVTTGKGMTAKGGFFDMGGKSGSLLGIEATSEFGNWLGGSTRTKKHKKHRPKHTRHRKHHGRRIKSIEYY